MTRPTRRELLRRTLVGAVVFGLGPSLLEAAQATSGDNRGRRSAGILVFGDELYPYLDARADDHPQPVAELRRLVDIAAERRRTSSYYSTRLEDMPDLAALAPA